MTNTQKKYELNAVADLDKLELKKLAKMDPSDINPDLEDTHFEVVDLKSFVLKKLLKIRESLGPKGGKDDDGRKSRLADFRVNLMTEVITYNTYHTPTKRSNKSSASNRGGRKSRRPSSKKQRKNRRSTIRR